MKKRIVPALLATASLTNSAMAQTAAPESWHAKNIGEALGYSALFGLLGIVMVVVGFKLFDKIITRIDLEEEIKKGNVAAAVLSAGAIIAIGIIIAASMG